MSRPNYFLLLNISPNENNEENIKEAINKKRAQWQAETKNPRKQIAARENLALLPDIENVMLNSLSRADESASARAEREKHISVLKNEIMLLQSKGFVTEDEISGLCQRHESIERSEILSMISARIEGQNSGPAGGFLTEDQIRQMEAYFSSLSIDDMSFYEFYNIENGGDVITAAEYALRFILQKGQKSFSDEVEQKLAGLAKSIFAESKNAYDNFLRGNRYIKLNNYIKTALANDKIEANSFIALSKIAQDEYEMGQNEFLDYLKHNAETNGFVIDDSISMLVLLTNMNIGQNQININQNTQHVEKQDIDKFEELVDNKVEDSEEDKRVESVRAYINQCNAIVNKSKENLESNIKILNKNYNNKKDCYITNKELYIYSIISLIIAFFNILFMNKFSFKVKDLVVANIALPTLVAITTYGFNMWFKKIDKHYQKAISEYKEGIDIVNEYEKLDKGYLYGGTQADFDEFKAMVDSINRRLNSMADEGQLFLKTLSKYPVKRYALYGLIAVLAIEAIIIASTFMLGREFKIGW